MKKLMSIMVAMTLIINASIAQSGFAFGLKAGANYSNQYDSKNNDVSAEAKFGFAGGAFLAIPLGKYFGVQPEVLFSQKGFKATGKVLGSPYDLTRTTNYIDVPLMLAIKPVEFITIVGGPHYSYLIKQKDVFSNNVFTSEQTQAFNNEDIRKNIFGFIGGVDINVKNIVIGLRAGWDVQNNNGDGTSTTPRYKNAWTQATLGFRLY
jgi:hypothetical protein